MKYLKLLAAAVVMTGAAAGVAHADKNKKVNKACAGDYQNFCSQYAPKSAQLRACFEVNRKKLSDYCVAALVDAGRVPRKYLKK
jgi:hypothetical protein